MPGEVHNDSAGDCLDAITGRATVTLRTVYLTTATAAVTDATTAATLSETAASGHARQACAFDVPAGDPLETANAALESFGPYTSNPANITHCCLRDQVSGTAGVIPAFWTLDTARDPATDDTLEFAADAVKLNAD